MKVFEYTILFCAVVFLTGCGVVEESMEAVMVPEPAPAESVIVSRAEETIRNRFDSEGVSAADGLGWSVKYQQLLEKTQALTEKNSSLELENVSLRQKVSQLDAELGKSNAELADANAFLADMQVELSNWKKDVLGFRDQTLDAQKAQLQALNKILRLLGAESSEVASAAGASEQ